MNSGHSPSFLIAAFARLSSEPTVPDSELLTQVQEEGQWASTN
jgi:hypothetical protein